MLRSFVLSPLVGMISAGLGWVAAIFFRDSMSPAEFEALRFGWEGSMIGATAIALLLLMWYVGNNGVDPIISVGAAVVSAFLLWNRDTLPFGTGNFDTATDQYWATVGTMVLILVMLLLGLRASREGARRVR